MFQWYLHQNKINNSEMTSLALPLISCGVVLYVFIANCLWNGTMGYTMGHNRKETSSSSNSKIRSIENKRLPRTLFTKASSLQIVSMQMAFPYYPVEASHLMRCLAGKNLVSKNLWKWQHIGEILLSNSSQGTMWKQRNARTMWIRLARQGI